MSNQLPTEFQEFIALSRYARWLPSEKRRETWGETVGRYTDEIVNERLAGIDYVGSAAIDIEQAIMSLEVMPSMRSMMTAGKAAMRDNTCMYNCSYLPVDDPKSFDEAMFILLCGTGVGFSVERQYVSKLPDVPDKLFNSDTTVAVKDSKEGWAKAYRQVLSLLWAGEIPKWDVSKVRPAGAKLKTFGGRASGPAPLVDLFQFTIQKFKGAAGRKLSSIECHDIMCKIGEVVVVGGVRRSAMISLSNLSDDRMRHAKSGQWWETQSQRGLANNSVCYTEKPDVETFMREWTALVESKSGERGVFNRVASKKQAEKYGRRDPNFDFGTNPCCVSGDTLILTRGGYKPISETVGNEEAIWNGESWANVEPYEAGEADLFRVTLSDGSYLDCTSNHRWCVSGDFITTDDLTVGTKIDKFEMPVVGLDNAEIYDVKEAYSQGFYSGDGTRGYTRSWLYEPKFDCEKLLKGRVHNDSVNTHRKVWNHGPMLDKSFVPMDHGVGFKLAWLAGLLDADGCVTRDKNGNGFQIASIDHDFLDRLRLMLTTLGVRAKVVSASAAGNRMMPDGKGGLAEYYCKETKRLLVGNTDAYKLMSLGLGLSLQRLDHNGVEPQRDARQFVKVISVEDLGRSEMTYCFTEPKTSRGTFNGIVTGNSEIILRPYQFCNLSEVVVRATDTLEDLERKVKLATILGTIQSTYTYFPYLRKIWQKNTEEERLLGVSLTGIMDNPLMTTKNNGLEKTLEHLRNVAVDTNAEWAARLDIPVSASITCVKPSGTVSQLVDSASGIHTRHSEYYIRTVRGDSKDPLTQLMIDQGVPNELCVMKPDQTTVFSFPIKAPTGCVTRDDMTAIEQLETWLVYQRHWCEHKPSVTVSVKEDEWFEVGAFVYKNFDEMSGVSFLPHDGGSYQQAPYQEVTKEGYEELLDKMPKSLDWSKLSEYEDDDNTSGMQTMACASGVCEIVDLT
tara:strand:+ start:25109 stop:27982 length:2874 start_codon:yes stop_codon:yes gene_type:complete